VGAPEWLGQPKEAAQRNAGLREWCDRVQHILMLGSVVALEEVAKGPAGHQGVTVVVCDAVLLLDESVPVGRGGAVSTCMRFCFSMRAYPMREAIKGITRAHGWQLAYHGFRGRSARLGSH
jgi:hypothetical protein